MIAGWRLVFAWLCCRGGSGDSGFLKAKIVTARFYCEHLLPRAGACLDAIEAGPDSLSSRLATILLGPMLLRSMRKRLKRELDALERAITG